MVTGKMFRMALDKFFKSPVAQEARVQICMPDGQMYDIKDIKLMENKLEYRIFLIIIPIYRIQDMFGCQESVHFNEKFTLFDVT